MKYLTVLFFLLSGLTVLAQGNVKAKSRIPFDCRYHLQGLYLGQPEKLKVESDTVSFQLLFAKAYCYDHVAKDHFNLMRPLLTEELTVKTGSTRVKAAFASYPFYAALVMSVTLPLNELLRAQGNYPEAVHKLKFTAESITTGRIFLYLNLRNDNGTVTASFVQAKPENLTEF